MNDVLKRDGEKLPDILQYAKEKALARMQGIKSAFVAPEFPPHDICGMPDAGMGAEGAMDEFFASYADYMFAEPGPNFFGFVIGGTTPAALAGDWLTSSFDQNAFGIVGNVDRHIEQETMQMVCDLLGLGGHFHGMMTSGATMATFTALAVAREWVAENQGIDASNEGTGHMNMRTLAGTPHASIYKALSMLGLGRSNMALIELEEGRERMNISRLEHKIRHDHGRSVVVASLGTVDSGDYDDIKALAELRRVFPFWLHIDGAIAGPAASLPEFSDRFLGLDMADSITLDCHKWFNTPYDGALTLLKRRDLQYRVFAQAKKPSENPETAAFFNLAPEGSRRFRALPLWMSLKAYGKQGYQDIFRRNCGHARLAYQLLCESGKFTMLHEPHFNIVSFTLPGADMKAVSDFALKIRRSGKTFSNTTMYRGETPAMRLCFSNWQTEEENVKSAVEAIIALAE